MRFFLFAFFAFSVCIIGHAQAVLGINFGVSHEVVKTSLEKRYGIASVLEENGALKVYDISVGDYKFDMGFFDFQYQGSKSYFYYAEFQMNFETGEGEKAKRIRDGIKEVMETKYPKVIEKINEQGYKYYLFGTNPFSEAITHYEILLETKKEKSVSGKEYLYVVLSYGPYHYIDEASDF